MVAFGGGKAHAIERLDAGLQKGLAATRHARARNHNVYAAHATLRRLARSSSSRHTHTGMSWHPACAGGRRPSSSGRTSNNSFTCASMAKSHATTRARWPLLRTAVAVRSACGAPPHRCPVTASRQPVYARAVCHGGRRWVFGSSHGVNLIVIARVGSLDAFAHLFFVLVVAVSEYHVRTLHCEMLCGGPVETKCHRVPRSYAAAWRLCARALDR